MFSVYLILERSYTVSEDFIILDGLKFNFDFVATPTTEARKATIQWKHFFKRVPWDVQQNPAPSQLTAMEITPGVVYHYSPIAPFDLSQDSCYTWLDWHVYTLVNGNDIHVLRTRDPALDTAKTNAALNREIGAVINYESYYFNDRSSRSAGDNDENPQPRSSKRRANTHDDEDPPLTMRYLREALDRQYDRFVRETNRISNRFLPYQNNNNTRRFSGNSSFPNSFVPPAPQVASPPQSIPATPNGNNPIKSQLSTEDVINLFRTLDRNNV